MEKAVNVLALVRNGHRYVFLYDDQSLDTLRAQLAIFAEDPELDFNWRDAANLHDRLLSLGENYSCSEIEDFPTYF